jgi:P2-related tail formation protein
MKIKINEQNRAALQAALETSNGTATAHTFRHVIDLIDRARQAEAKLEQLALKKGSRSGAIAAATSGGSVANAYKYARITSTARMVRGSSAWFLIALSTSETYRRTAGDTFISLTPAQDAEVTATFRSQYLKQEVAK